MEQQLISGKCSPLFSRYSLSISGWTILYDNADANATQSSLRVLISWSHHSIHWYSNGYELFSATRWCVRDSKRGHYITVRRWRYMIVRRGHYMTVRTGHYSEKMTLHHSKKKTLHDSKKRTLHDSKKRTLHHSKRGHYMTVRRGHYMTIKEDITWQ